MASGSQKSYIFLKGEIIPVIKEMIRAFMLVFAAEMGDKTQLIAMTFATQYLIKDVIIGVTLGVIFNHGLAIILGKYLSTMIDLNIIQIIAGFMFVVFGIMSLKDEEIDTVEENKGMSPIITVALAFFVGELGDKTQLTAMTLSTEGHYPIFILMGTTLAMVATSSLGIFVGTKIGDKIPETLIKITSSLVFLCFGIVKLLNVLPTKYINPLNISIFLILIGALEISLMRRLIKQKSLEGTQSQFKIAASKLYNQTETLKKSLDSICLGEDKCGGCKGKECLVGYIRFILKDAREREKYYEKFNMDMNKFIRKDYDKEAVIDSLALIIVDYNKYGWKDDETFIVNKIRGSLEHILFKQNMGNIIDYEKYIIKVKEIDFKLGQELEKEIDFLLNLEGVNHEFNQFNVSR